jgi:ATP-binding cassette, subfamily F, member 3
MTASDNYADVFTSYLQENPLDDLTLTGKRGHRARLDAIKREERGLKSTQRGAAAFAEKFCDDIVWTRPTRFWIDRFDRRRCVDLKDLTLAVADRVLLDQAELRLFENGRYGVVGANGCGKTTLMRRIAAGLVVNWPTHMSAMLVSQQQCGTDESALEVLLNCDPERRRLVDEEDELLEMLARGDSVDEDGNALEERLERVHARMEVIGVHDAEARAERILAELRFDDAMRHAPTSTLSGGWRMRVALARAMFIRPDVLFLDEPTNHLDLAGIAWLTEFLRDGSLTTAAGGDAPILVIVSHDRAFLDATTTSTIIFDGTRLAYHNGSYQSWVERTAEVAERERHFAEQQQQQREHMQRSIDNVRAAQRKHKLGGAGSGMIGSRKKAMERIGVNATADGKKFKQSYTGETRRLAEAPPPPPVAAPLPLRGGDVCTAHDASDSFMLLDVRDITFRWRGPNAPIKSTERSPLLLRNVSLSVVCGQRIAIMAPNGVGKSTLLNIVAGKVKPRRGQVRLGRANVRVAYYEQHTSLDDERTTIDLLRDIEGAAAPERDLRKHLAAFGVKGHIADAKMGVLSGGQRARIVWAKIAAMKPDVILADEPSNHLDLYSVESLEKGLRRFPGAIVLVSHDVALIDALQCELHTLESANLTRYNDTIQTYQRRSLRRMKRANK